MSKEKTVSQAIDYRRSVRVYDPECPLDAEKVKQCLQQAALAPNSSNMQLWEFIHITDKGLIKDIAPLESVELIGKMLPVCLIEWRWSTGMLAR